MSQIATVEIEYFLASTAISALSVPLYVPLVESREAIKPRPSQLDLDVPLSVHPAPDILGSCLAHARFRFTGFVYCNDFSSAVHMHVIVTRFVYCY